MSFEPISVSTSSTAIPQVETSSPTTAKINWRIPEIDGLRAFAMLMVVLYHTWQCTGSSAIPLPFLGVNLSSALAMLPAGVDMFMVLSGFCLFLPLCRKNREDIKFDTKKYAIRRIRRIVPPYYAAIAFAAIFPNLLVAIFLLAGKEAKWQSLPSAFQIITHLSFTHIFFVEAWAQISGAFWSLGLEVQFYLIFPIFVFLYQRFGIKVVWWMAITSILYRVGVAIGFQVTNNVSQDLQDFDDLRFLWDTNLAGRLMQFAAGIWAAYYVSEQWKNEKKLSAPNGTLLILMAIGVFAATSINFPSLLRYLPVRDILLSVSYVGLLVAICTTQTKFRTLFSSRPMAGLGYISYSVFLIHQPILYYCSEFVRRFSHVEGTQKFLLVLIVGFTTSVLISLPFFKFFERPFLNNSTKPKPELGIAA